MMTLAAHIDYTKHTVFHGWMVGRGRAQHMLAIVMP